MNKIILIGNLTSDPDLRFIAASGTAVTTITLAVARDFKKEGQPEADFLRCVCYGKKAEVIANNFTKGKKIAINGRIETGSYDKNGTKVYTTDIVIEGFDFVEKKQQNEQQQPPVDTSEMEPVIGDDIPF